MVESSALVTAIEEWRRGSTSQNRAWVAATAVATATATGSGAAVRAEDLTGSGHGVEPAELRRPGSGSAAAGLSRSPGALAGTPEPECRRHFRPGLGTTGPCSLETPLDFGCHFSLGLIPTCECPFSTPLAGRRPFPRCLHPLWGHLWVGISGLVPGATLSHSSSR